MAKVKVVNTRLDSNLNGTNFNNIPSETIFSFGSFTITSNFDGRTPIDYTGELSSFVRPVTLETMGVTEVQSQILHTYATNAILNLDKSDLNTFVRYGSAYEFLRTTIERIILNYPGSLFLNSQITQGGNSTFYDFNYNIITNTSTLRIPVSCVVNKFNLVYNDGNQSIPDNIELKNLNLSYDKYIVWSAENSTGNSYSIIGFTGFTTTVPYIYLKVIGNPFPTYTGTSGKLDFHIKPNNLVFEEFRGLLTDYQKYMVSNRNGTNGFNFMLKDPTLLEDGTIVYSDSQMLWMTGDKYNIDIDTPNYRNFLNSVLTIGSKYDAIKTDLIARFLTPASLKTYDLTEEGKMTKLLRIYGREFDELRQFIDSLVNINKVTYDKINNIPDQLIKNLSRTFGWNYFSLVNENELVETFLTVDDQERNLNESLLPGEIDIELWRRILINTNYFWKSKGTREAIKSMFLLIGIPEPFINITEYVYTVDGRIDPNTVPLTLEEFPSASLPYDSDGYPAAPIETNEFFFQVSGDTDSGQAYMDVFRMAGFDLMKTVDNKKSWVEAEEVTRIDDTTPQYYQKDSKLVLNTKEVDVALDTARGIEYDVYNYIQTDFAANSSGYTLPFSYVNISLGVTGSQQTFPLPAGYSSNKVMGDLEVRFNGILLNAPKSGTTTGYTYQADYIIDEVTKTFTLTGETGAMYAQNNSNRRDVVQATFIYSGGTHSVTGVTVQYMVTRAKASAGGTIIELPSMPRGDVQVTIQGIALTKGTPQFTADYIVDPANTTGYSQIIIQNPDAKAYLAVKPEVQVAYVQVEGSNDISARSEVIRVDSFSSSKIYYNYGASKYVYKLNYKANSAKDLKVLIDGIALEPNMDYSVNVMNPYEIFLPNGIKYGTVISVYYLVGTNELFAPVVSNSFGVGDISQLSFLEFLELIQRRMINARNRKTITDFKGGWYPTLLRVYIEYLKRADLPDNNPLQSNGYTFQNLYSFLSKYNAFFQRFVDQLLSATIILKKGGLLIRNSIFTKQKFTYKRGTNLYADESIIFDKRGNPMLQYYGDDGSVFLIRQDEVAPSITTPTVITYAPIFITQTGGTTGGNVTLDGGAPVTSRGVAYGATPNPTIVSNYYTGNGSGLGSYTSYMVGLTPSTLYYVRAYAVNGAGVGYGNQYSFTTAAIVVPSLETKLHTSVTQTSIVGTGGINIAPSGIWSSVDFYNMQYRKWNGFNWESWQQTPLLAGPLGVNNFTITISGLSANTMYQYQSHMVVAGNDYYGTTIRTATTAAIIPALPTVTTGGECWTLTTPYAITISGNCVTYAGIPAETEHGLVWSLAPNPTIADFNDNNFPNPYAITMSSLSPNTSYYARAYACNTVGYAYGNEISVTTPAIPKEVNMVLYGSQGADGGGFRYECYCLTTTPPMVAGECFCICIGLPLGVSPSLLPFDGVSCSSYCIYCKGVSMPGYVLYWGANPSFCDLYNTACSPDMTSCKEFIFCYGDNIRILQKAVTKSGREGLGGTNSCACIRGITSISGTFDIGTTCCNSCAYSG